MQYNNQRGFSLIEWMVSIVVGLFITAGISSLFVAGQRTTDDTFQFGEMQEQGRLALEMLSQDIRHIGFYGDFTGNLMLVSPMLRTTDQPTKQCLDDKSLPTFPTTTGEFRSVWAMQVASNGSVTDMDCIVDTDTNTSLVNNSMVLSLKRVMSESVACSDIDTSRYYLAANGNEAEIIKGGNISSDCSSLNSEIPLMRLWEFQHHVYYLDQINNADGTVTPQLRMMELKVHGLGNGMYRDSGGAVQGIEDMQFMFGVDATGGGDVDQFLPLSSITNADWDQQRVVAMQVFILIRARSASNLPYTNIAHYQLGDRTVKVNDRYKRLLLSAIVPLRNQVIFNGG